MAGRTSANGDMTNTPAVANSWTKHASIDRHDLRHFRNLLANVPFNSMLQRHMAAWTAEARAVETNTDQAVGLHINQFDIAAVGLNRRANQVDDRLNLF